jgi:hypothetical protein
MDPGLPQLNAQGSYKYWGEAKLPGVAKGVPEPDNAQGDESCAVANYTEAFGKPARWGWADTLCSSTFVFLCRMQSELLAQRSCYLLFEAAPRWPPHCVPWSLPRQPW